jgi:Zn-dependent protease
LLPIPPLDGGRIAVSLLPNRQAYQFSRIEPYGIFIIIALLFTGMLNYLMGPLVWIFMHNVAQIFGVSPVDLYKLLTMMSR